MSIISLLYVTIQPTLHRSHFCLKAKGFIFPSNLKVHENDLWEQSNCSYSDSDESVDWEVDDGP